MEGYFTYIDRFETALDGESNVSLVLTDCKLLTETITPFFVDALDDAKISFVVGHEEQRLAVETTCGERTVLGGVGRVRRAHVERRCLHGRGCTTRSGAK